MDVAAIFSYGSCRTNCWRKSTIVVLEDISSVIVLEGCYIVILLEGTYTVKLLEKISSVIVSEGCNIVILLEGSYSTKQWHCKLIITSRRCVQWITSCHKNRFFRLSVHLLDSYKCMLLFRARQTVTKIQSICHCLKYC